MQFLKDSIDYQINMNAFYEMEEAVPMTKPERDAIHKWDSAKRCYAPKDEY